MKVGGGVGLWVPQEWLGVNILRAWLGEESQGGTVRSWISMPATRVQLPPGLITRKKRSKPPRVP